MHLGGKIEVVVEVPAEDARRPLDGLHARASPASAWRSPTTASKVFEPDDQAEHRRRRHRRHRGARARRHRPRGARCPVMEGKAMLFKEFGGVDAFPICLDTKDPDEIVATVTRDRAGLRRHQPRGHLGAALLRDRGAAARDARHPGLPRRPARHRDRRPRRARERAQGRRQADRGPAGRRRRRRRRRRRGDEDAARAPASRDVVGCDRQGAISQRRRDGLDASQGAGTRS